MQSDSMREFFIDKLFFILSVVMALRIRACVKTQRSAPPRVISTVYKLKTLEGK